MKNSNAIWVASAIKDVRRWIEREVPWGGDEKERARDIDDLVQNVCLIAVERLGENPENLGEARVKAWLRKTCQNLGMRYRYKLFVEIGRFERRNVVELELPPLRTQPDEEALRRAIRSVWRRLNQQQRKVLLMWANGMAWYEIAEELGISVNAVFERRKEIIARFKEQHDDALFSIVPPGIVRSQQAHPVAWTMGIMATLAFILWLIGMDDDGDTGPTPVPAMAESREDEAARSRRGGAGPPPAPTPPPLPTTTVTTAPSTMETPTPRIDTNDAASAIVAVPKPDLRKRSSIRKRAHLPKESRELPIVDAPITPATKMPSPVEQEEAKLMSDARIAYRRKDYATAKMLLDEHARHFPTGALATDREKLEVPVLCALGRPSEAEITERVLRTHHDPGPLRCDIPRRRKTSIHRTQTR